MNAYTQLSFAVAVAVASALICRAATIESHMVLNASGNISIPKKSVVLAEKGGTGGVTAKAHTMHGGADDEHKGNFDKKADEISNVMFDGKPFAKGQSFPAFGAYAEKGTKGAEYAFGKGFQALREETHKDKDGATVHDKWIVDLETEAKATGDTSLKDGTAAAGHGTSTDPWAFDVIDPTESFFLNFSLLSGTEFGVSGPGTVLGSFFVGTDIPGLEEILRGEFGIPQPGSTDPWFHVTATPKLGISDGVLESSLRNAFALEASTGAYVLRSDLPLLSLEIPTAGLSGFSMTVDIASDAQVGTPEPELTFLVAGALCIGVAKLRKRQSGL